VCLSFPVTAFRGIAGVGNKAGQLERWRDRDLFQDLLDWPGQIRVMTSRTQKDRGVGIQCVWCDFARMGGIRKLQQVSLVPCGR
jgi:hypothetical protein